MDEGVKGGVRQSGRRHGAGTEDGCVPPSETGGTCGSVRLGPFAVLYTDRKVPGTVEGV